ncbi:MAG: nicotinamide-nucleotide amidohydrolase family protein [Campylobacterales bacterium]|nr:nicotinamide-nucleotide amidohydrolase family protein [Campylobacterales bacterium]
MEHALLIIGDPIWTNQVVMKSIRREYLTLFKEEGDTFFMDSSSSELPFFLEDLIGKYKNLTIVTLEKNSPTISKILSTLTEDTLVLKDQVLLPSKVVKNSSSSYLLKHKDSYINMLSVDFEKETPPILIPQEHERFIFNLVGIDRESAQILLEPIAKTFEISLLITPWVEGLIRIEAVAQKYGHLEQFLKSAYSLFADKLFLSSSPQTHILKQLAEKNLTLSAAESCTGGLVSSMLARIPGASNVLLGSIVSYSNEVKKRWLGVGNDTLKNFGAVSSECVEEMLEGILKISKSNLAIAVSGVAGPDGGTVSKPVGTVFIGVARDDGSKVVERVLLMGTREDIQNKSALHCFRLLLQTYPKLFF